MTKATIVKWLKIIALIASTVAATLGGSAMLSGCAAIDKGAAGIADFADTNNDGEVSGDEARAAGDKVAAVVPPIPGFPWLETIIGGVATAVVTGAGAYAAHKRKQGQLADAVVKTVEAADNSTSVKAAFAENRIPAIEAALTKAKKL